MDIRGQPFYEKALIFSNFTTSMTLRMVEHRITSGWKNHSESTTAATHFKMKSILLDKIAEIIFFKNLYMQIQMLNIDNLSVSLN